MEWLLVLHLGIFEIPPPPPVAYPNREKCVEVARKIADQHKWIHYFDVDKYSLRVEPGVYRPTVYCEPAEWRKSPPASK